MVGGPKQNTKVGVAASLFRERAADCLTRPAAKHHTRYLFFQQRRFFPTTLPDSEAAAGGGRTLTERVTIWRRAEAHVPFGPRRRVKLDYSPRAAGKLQQPPETYINRCGVAGGALEPAALTSHVRLFLRSWWNHSRHGEISHAGFNYFLTISKMLQARVENHVFVFF